MYKQTSNYRDTRALISEDHTRSFLCFSSLKPHARLLQISQSIRSAPETQIGVLLPPSMTRRSARRFCRFEFAPTRAPTPTHFAAPLPEPGRLRIQEHISEFVCSGRGGNEKYPFGAPLPPPLPFITLKHTNSRSSRKGDAACSKAKPLLCTA